MYFLKQRFASNKSVIFILFTIYCIFMNLGLYANDVKSKAVICKLEQKDKQIIIDTAADELKLHLEKFYNMDVVILNGVAKAPAKGIRFFIGTGPQANKILNEKGKFSIVKQKNDIYLWGYDKSLIADQDNGIRVIPGKEACRQYINFFMSSGKYAGSCRR